MARTRRFVLIGRSLRAVAVVTVGLLLVGLVVALPAVVRATGSGAAAAEDCASPTPSTTRSATATPSATSTATTSPSPSGGGNPVTGIIGGIIGGSPSPSRSATATASATPTATTSPRECRPLTVRVNTPMINATGRASVTVTGAQPGSRVELQGYSQNHEGTQSFANDRTPVDRAGTADANGAVTFNDLRPASNTRVRARQQNGPYGDSAVINVRTQLTMQVTRDGQRSYTFTGRSIPARPGGLIVSLYRIGGHPCAAGAEPSTCAGEDFVTQARAVALGQRGEGTYRIRVTFPVDDQNVRDEFVVKTGRDAQNAPGRSNARSLLIY